MRLLITGTPCTGKTTLSLAIAKQLGCPLLAVNDLVSQMRCYSFNRRKEKEVEMSVLSRALKKILLAFEGKDLVVEGHLLTECSKLPCDKVLVLRCDPRVLQRRMDARAYYSQKIADNVTAEVIDYFQVKAEDAYASKVLQLDCTTPLSAKTVLRRLKGKKSDFVDWTPLLLAGKLSSLKAKRKENVTAQRKEKKPRRQEEKLIPFA